MPTILSYQYLNFWKYLRNSYIYHVYFVYNFNRLSLLFRLLFSIAFINGTRINFKNNNNNNNNNLKHLCPHTDLRNIINLAINLTCNYIDYFIDKLD